MGQRKMFKIEDIREMSPKQITNMNTDDRYEALCCILDSIEKQGRLAEVIENLNLEFGFNIPVPKGGTIQPQT